MSDDSDDEVNRWTKPVVVLTPILSRHQQPKSLAEKIES